MLRDQVAARAHSLQSVFGSTFWRTHIIAADAIVGAVSAVPGYGASYWWLQRTALGTDTIGAILKAGIGPSAFPTYECAAAEAQGVRPHYQCTS